MAGTGGALCFAALVALNSPSVAAASSHAQFVLLAAGLLLLVWALRPVQAGRLRREGGLLVMVLLLAAGLRLWNLEHAVHFYVDEGNFVEAILRLQTEDTVRLMAPFHYVASYSWVYPYLQNASVAVFGHNLLGLRVVSAAFGVLTVAAIYRLGRVLYGRRVGLLAALLLAVFPPHIHFSRLGLNNIADPLFGVLALAFLAQGIKQGRWRHLALAGVMLGLSQYFYEGGRLVYLLLALGWGLLAVLSRRIPVRGLLVMGGMAALVAAPFYGVMLGWQVALAPGFERRGLDAVYWQRLLLEADSGLLAAHLREHVLPPWLHYITLPDQSAFFYGGHTALVLPHLLPLLAVGVVMALRRSVMAGALLLLWLALTALGNSLVRDSVWTARYVAAFPALALLLAMGTAAALRWLRRSAMLRGLLLAVVVVSQGVYYFGPHLTAYQRQIRPHHDQQDVIFRLRALPPDTRVYWITDDPDLWLPLLVFLSRFWDMPDFAPELRHPNFVEDWEALDQLERGVTHAFFVEQEDRRTQEYLQARFGLDEPRYSPYNVPREKQFVLLVYQP